MYIHNFIIYFLTFIYTIYRFKINHNNNTVWVDITDGFSHVPTFNSCIYMKVCLKKKKNNKK